MSVTSQLEFVLGDREESTTLIAVFFSLYVLDNISNNVALCINQSQAYSALQR